MNPSFTSFTLGALLGTMLFASKTLAAENALPLNLRARAKIPGTDRFTTAERKVAWDAKKTALIICDMWDDHWCKSASTRVGEMAGPLNDVVKVARARGVCSRPARSAWTAFDDGTPQRRRAQAARLSPVPVPLTTTERWGTA